MDIHAFYHDLGENSENPLHRFGSEALLKKYLFKLPGDQTFSGLAKAMEQRDCQQAFRCAHTLKGVALNLSLEPLSTTSAQITELLRNAHEIPQAADELFSQLCQTYQHIILNIEQLQ